MSLPKSPVAADEAVITDSFWNDLVENYEAIFDGSAFDPGTVTTKYGTVARTAVLNAATPTRNILLESGKKYLALIFNTNPAVKTGRITQGVSLVAASAYKEAVSVFTTFMESATLTAWDPSESWGSEEVRFILIKLDNNASDWLSTAVMPYPGLEFEDEEKLQASKVNKVIANVNASKTQVGAIGVDRLKVQGNTKTSMVPLGYENGVEVTTPGSINSEAVVATMPFEITENLESSLIMISVSAEYLWSSNPFRPLRVDVLDSDSNVVATKDFEYYQADLSSSGLHYAVPINLRMTGLDSGEYTVEVIYYLQGSGTRTTNTAYAGITNITALAFGG